MDLKEFRGSLILILACARVPLLHPIPERYPDPRGKLPWSSKSQREAPCCAFQNPGNKTPLGKQSSKGFRGPFQPLFFRSCFSLRTSLWNSLGLFLVFQKNPVELEFGEKLLRLLGVNIHLLPHIFLGGPGIELLLGEVVWVSLDVLTVNPGRVWGWITPSAFQKNGKNPFFLSAGIPVISIRCCCILIGVDLGWKRLELLWNEHLAQDGSAAGRFQQGIIPTGSLGFQIGFRSQAAEAT